MIQASEAFRRDTNSNSTQITPFMVLGERQLTNGDQNWDKHLFLSGGNLDVIHQSSTYWGTPYPKIPHLPAIKTIPYIKQSFDFFTHNFTTSTITFELINAPYKSGLLSDEIIKYSKKEIRLYYFTQSCKNWAFRPWLNSDPNNQGLLGFTGKIVKIKHDKHTISIECEDLISKGLDKKIPLERNKLDNFQGLEKDKGKYLPIVYGEVPLAPAYITKTPKSGFSDSYKVMTENTNHRSNNFNMGSFYIKSGKSYCLAPATAGMYPHKQSPQSFTTKNAIYLKPEYEDLSPNNHIAQEKIILINTKNFLNLSSQSSSFEAKWELNSQNYFSVLVDTAYNGSFYEGEYPNYIFYPDEVALSYFSSAVFGDNETVKSSLKTEGDIKNYIQSKKDNNFSNIQIQDMPIFREDNENLKIGAYKEGSGTLIDYLHAFSWQFEIPFQNQINDSDICTPEDLNPDANIDTKLHHETNRNHIVWYIEGEVEFDWKRKSSDEMGGSTYTVEDSDFIRLGMSLNIDKKTYNTKAFLDLRGHTNNSFWYRKKTFSYIIDSVGFQDDYGYDIFSGDINTSIKIAPMCADNPVEWLSTFYEVGNPNEAYPSANHGKGAPFPIWEIKNFKINNLKITSQFVSKDFIEKDFYAYTKGRYNHQNILDKFDYSSAFGGIENELNFNSIEEAFLINGYHQAYLDTPTATMVDLATDEGGAEKVDAFSIHRALIDGYRWSDHNNFRFNFSIDGKNRKTVKDHIIEMANATEHLFPLFKRSGSFGFASLQKTYTDYEYNEEREISPRRAQVVLANDVMKYSFDNTDFSKAKRQTTYNYYKDPSEDRYQESFTKIPDFALSSGADAIHNIMYGYPSDNNYAEGEKVINNAYSKDIANTHTTGKDFHHYLTVNLTLPIKYCYLECGDLIRFDELLDNYKPYGENYLLWEEHPQYPSRYSYPIFMINSFKMNDKNVHIEAFRLHQLHAPTNITTAMWNEINASVDSTAIPFQNDIEPTIYGCTNPSATNYNPDANTDDGSCYFNAGCTHPLADNYNADADFDNGSCTFENVETPPPTIVGLLDIPAYSLDEIGLHTDVMGQAVDQLVDNPNHPLRINSHPAKKDLYPWLVHKYFSNYPPMNDYKPPAMLRNSEYAKDPYDMVIDLRNSFADDTSVEYNGDSVAIENGLQNSEESFFLHSASVAAVYTDLGSINLPAVLLQDHSTPYEDEDGNVDYRIIRIHMLEVYDAIKANIDADPSLADQFQQINNITSVSGYGNTYNTEDYMPKIGMQIKVAIVDMNGNDSAMSFTLNNLPVPPWLYSNLPYNFYDLCTPPMAFKPLYGEATQEYPEVQFLQEDRVLNEDLMNHYYSLMKPWEEQSPNSYVIAPYYWIDFNMDNSPDSESYINPIPFALWDSLSSTWMLANFSDLIKMYQNKNQSLELPWGSMFENAYPEVETKRFIYGGGEGSINTSKGLARLEIKWSGDVSFEDATPKNVSFQTFPETFDINMYISLPENAKEFSEVFTYRGDLKIESATAYGWDLKPIQLRIVEDVETFDKITTHFDKISTHFDKLNKQTSFGRAKDSKQAKKTDTKRASGETGGY